MTQFNPNIMKNDIRGVKTNGETAAYPIVVETGTFPDSGRKEFGVHHGLSKREFIAAMAMQGILSSDNINMKNMPYEEKAKFSVVMADELLKALEK